MNKRILFSSALVLILSATYLYSQPQPAVDPNLSTTTLTQTESGDQLTQQDSLFDNIKKGGAMMFPIILLGLLGLVILFERIIYFIRSGVYKTSSIREYIKETSKGHFQFREELEEALREAVIIYRDKMERGLSLLNGIGALAPLLGFLGTVIGMISAFASIAVAATVNAKVVASGIQVALVTTAGGLSVAVPVLAGFHYLNHMVQKVLSEANISIQSECAKLPSIMREGE